LGWQKKTRKKLCRRILGREKTTQRRKGEALGRKPVAGKNPTRGWKALGPEKKVLGVNSKVLTIPKKWNKGGSLAGRGKKTTKRVKILRREQGRESGGGHDSRQGKGEKSPRRGGVAVVGGKKKLGKEGKRHPKDGEKEKQR